MAKLIEKNPDPISEGIWFVIQNKYELESVNGGDYDIPARRIALKYERIGSNHSLKMAEMPLYGDNDEFLWKVVKGDEGMYFIVNRKAGDNQRTLSETSMRYYIHDKASDPAGAPTQWIIKCADRERFGTNVYSLTGNSIVTTGKAMHFKAADSIFPEILDTSSTRQAWVFQPMELVNGYEIPRLPDGGKERFLELPYGYKLKATDTVSDWALLNTHLIYKNMLNALLPVQVAKIQANRNSYNKDILIISKEDPHEISAEGSSFDPIWVENYRGGASRTGFTLVTEEMMCKTGVLTDIFPRKFKTYREFEQVVHEFAHTLQRICEITYDLGNKEDFAWEVQYLFNSAHSEGPNRNKSVRSAANATFFETVFNKENSWIPPRKLREANNLAFRRLATSSSVSHNIEAAAAVNGNTHPLFRGGSVTHSQPEDSPWWQVDLGEIYPIEKVVIWNRIDSLDEYKRLDDFKIAISETPIAKTGDATLIDFSPLPWTPALRSQTVSINKRARYVRVFVEGSQKILSLAEVEVFPQAEPKNYFENPIVKLTDTKTDHKQPGTRDLKTIYELGAVFSAAVAGHIFQAGSRMPKSGNYRIMIWDFEKKSVLKELRVFQHSDDTIALESLDVPLRIEPNKKYVISISNLTLDKELKPYYYFGEPRLLPTKVDNISIHESVYSSLNAPQEGADLPKVFPDGYSESGEMYGLPEFTFLP